MPKIHKTELFSLLEEILLSNNFSEEVAKVTADIFIENTLVGVSSHGVNRFSSFIELVQSGYIKPSASPHKINEFNALEQWNGNLGPGPNNALYITEKVMELSEKYGIGCISLSNTNHWMRPGYYAWHAADKGKILICWTNTIPIMPPWGGRNQTIGNNPIVLGVPRESGNIVIDMALSQYSYGKLANYARENKELPFDGGYDSDDNLTKDAKAIYDCERPLPIGYWKGSGLALLLDLIATILSGGKSTFNLGESVIDSGMSQIFIAIDPIKFQSVELVNKSVDEILEFYLSAEPMESENISYPGERIIAAKKKNLSEGIIIDDQIWQGIQNLRSGK